MSFWILLLLWSALGYFDRALVTPQGGVPWWGALGAALGVITWKQASRRKLKLAPALGLLLALFLGTQGLLALGDSLTSLSAGLGSDGWVLTRQRLSAAATLLLWVGGLRQLSHHYPSAAALEVTVACSLFVRALEAHRDGYINRPFQLVDPLWLKGLDPAPYFLALGLLALVVGLLLSSQRPGNRRSPWDLPLLLALLLGLALFVPQQRLKQVLEQFGLGNRPGQENRLTPPGKQPPPNNGTSQGSSSKDEPSFADTPPPPPPKPVAVVLFRDDYEPPSGVYYFRQSSNSQYNGLKLVQSNDPRFDQDVAKGFPTRYPQPNTPADPLGMKLPPFDAHTMRPLSTRVALLAQHSKPFGLDNPCGYWATNNPDPTRFQKAYEVESQVFDAEYRQLIGTPAGDPSWDEASWRHYLEAPKDSRYRELADQIVANLPEDRRQAPLFRAVAIKLWLDENCTYSLKSPSAQAADPVSHFLFGERVGYCVYTSHSAAFLYRAAGVPSRIASGYAVPAKQRADGSSLLVRSSDAHSWPEIYLQGVGWLELDISPKKNLEPEQDQVDNNLQQMLGDMARKDKKEQRPEDDRPPFDWLAWLRSLLYHLLRATPWALLAGWLLLSLAKVYRRLAPWLVSGPDLPRLAYLSALDLLAQQGCLRHSGESREAFARRLGPQVPALLELTHQHLSRKLGRGQTCNPQAVRQVLGQCLRQIASRPAPGWRKNLGWLDPFTSLRVR